MEHWEVMGGDPHYFQKCYTYRKNTILKFVINDLITLSNFIFIKKPVYFLKILHF